MSVSCEGMFSERCGVTSSDGTEDAPDDDGACPKNAFTRQIISASCEGMICEQGGVTSSDGPDLFSIA